MTDNKNLLLHYLYKHRTEPDPAKWRAAIVALFDEREADAERLRAENADLRHDVARYVGIATSYISDGERYRWLRRGNKRLVVLAPRDALEPLIDEELDAAIDAARAKETT